MCKRSLLFALMLPTISLAENRIGVGGGIIWGEDNTSTRGNSIIKSLGKPEDSFLRFIPLADINLSYMSGQNTYFLRTSLEAQVPGIQAGFRRRGLFFEATELYIGYNPFKRVWKDPYLTNIQREKTYQRDYEVGLRFFQGRSNLTIRSLYSDVKDDKLGEREKDLRRDRVLAEIGYAYRYSLSTGFSLEPSLNLKYSKAKGKANSYVGYGMGLSGIYRKDNYLLRAGLGVDLEVYQKQDPILLKRRREIGYYGFASLTRDNIFYRGLYITSLIGYRQVDSNADFYDRKALLLGVIAGYKW